MERLMVKKGEPIKIVIQPKKIEIVEHKIIKPIDETQTDNTGGSTP